MKERTIKILEALVREFIETANPVASKKLLESGNAEIQVSSATIRNEFSILEEVGLIASPHVSAGKIPTENGYRFFVNQMESTKNEEALVGKLFDNYLKSYHLEKSKENILDILRIISQLTGNVAFANINNDRSFYVGISQVLRTPEFLKNPEDAAKIIEVLEGRESFWQVLKSLDIEKNEIKIFIGEENILEAISSCAMIVTAFEREKVTGYIGILGPMRMSYSFNKSILKNAMKMV